jgi:hypothetical protein
MRRKGGIWNSIKSLIERFKSKIGTGGFLCDTCMYDYPAACHRPERPNATECPDYKKRV